MTHLSATWIYACFEVSVHSTMYAVSGQIADAISRKMLMITLRCCAVKSKTSLSTAEVHISFNISEAIECRMCIAWPKHGDRLKIRKPYECKIMGTNKVSNTRKNRWVNKWKPRKRRTEHRELKCSYNIVKPGSSEHISHRALHRLIIYNP